MGRSERASAIVSEGGVARKISRRVVDGTQFVADISIAKDIEGESSIKPYVRQGKLGVVLDVAAVVRHRELGLEVVRSRSGSLACALGYRAA